MPSVLSRQLFGICLVLCVLVLPALALLEKTDAPAPIHYSDLNACSAIQRLNDIVGAQEAAQAQDTKFNLHDFFSTLFPFADPGHNALLATFYISSFPNFVLFFIPPDIPTSVLNVMIAFATGGLMGDTFINLIPHAFLGEPAVEGGIQLVVVDKGRNVVVGVALFAGFALFFLIDKTMRYLASRAEEHDGFASSNGHSHSHSHSHSTAVTSAVESSEKAALRKRGSSATASAPNSEIVSADEDSTPAPATSIQLSAYLGIFADFTHNITDGLAMSAAFYASPTIGATTTIGTFFHEIPHELADYSILVKSGFSKKRALAAQFVTAIGALIGTLLGIAIQRYSSSGASSSTDNHADDLAAKLTHQASGFFGTGISAGELVIPAVAGSFLYIASVSVVPELLAESKSGRQLVKEGVAMAFGISAMAFLAWHE